MLADALPGGLGHANVGRTLDMHIAGHAEFSPAEDSSVTSPIICRSALALQAQRGAASFANPPGMGCGLRLALPPDGGARPTTSDRCRDTRPMAGVCEHTLPGSCL